MLKISNVNTIGIHQTLLDKSRNKKNQDVQIHYLLLYSLLFLSSNFLLPLLSYKSLVSSSLSIESLRILFVISSSEDESSDMLTKSKKNFQLHILDEGTIRKSLTRGTAPERIFTF